MVPKFLASSPHERSDMGDGPPPDVAALIRATLAAPNKPPTPETHIRNISKITPDYGDSAFSPPCTVTVMARNRLTHPQLADLQSEVKNTSAQQTEIRNKKNPSIIHPILYF